MEVCHSPPGSDRRYDWMKAGTDKLLYGRDGRCNNTQQLNSIPPTFLMSFCFCKCESEKRDADRYFSLQNVTSDVAENKVITGVKLEKLNNVFYIKIQQGELTTSASILGEPTWKDINEVPRKELEKTSAYHLKVLSLPYQNDKREYIYDEHTDFYKNKLVYAVTNDQNTVYLDDLNARPDEVLTGLRFQQVGNDLRLEIQATPVDYDTGKLRTESSHWIARGITTGERDEVKFSDPDDPTKALESDEYSSNNRYVRFRMTDLKHDLGQYTIPFLDIQAVTTNPSMPISGAGLFHKGNRHSGEFLALKLMHYDYTPHVTEDIVNFDSL